MKKIVLAIAIIMIGSSLFAIEDLTENTWVDAFKKLHHEVEKAYPFIEHKNINLDSLYQITLNAIEIAENNSDFDAYYLAMKNYAFAFHDNHVFLKKKGYHPYENEMAGHFGFEVVQLDNGDFVIGQIRNPNLRSLMNTGDRIIKWNQIEINKAIDETNLLTLERMEATAQNQLIRKCEQIVKAPVGEQLKLSIVQFGEKEKTIEVTAIDAKNLEDKIYFPKSTLYKKVIKSPIQFDIFDKENTGYIHIGIYMPNLGDLSLPSTFTSKLWILEKFHINSLIIDLRGNQGGIDKWAEKMAGHFIKEERIYQYIEKYNPNTGAFEIDSSLTSIVKPSEPYIDKEVVLLVDHETVSTGEGLPMVLKDLPNVTIAGQYHTAGAFASGFSNCIYKLPDGLVFGFLEGRSLDKNLKIQVDGNAYLKGGVVPEIKVPIDLESVKTQFTDKKDFVLNYIIEMLNKQSHE